MIRTADVLKKSHDDDFVYVREDKIVELVQHALDDLDEQSGAPDLRGCAP